MVAVAYIYLPRVGIGTRLRDADNNLKVLMAVAYAPNGLIFLKVSSLNFYFINNLAHQGKIRINCILDDP